MADHAIYQAVLLGNAARPATRHQIFEWFRFTDSGKWIAQDRFY